MQQPGTPCRTSSSAAASGPRGDGYRVDNQMTADEAQRYHEPQVVTFADTDADLVSALTLTYADEAVGVARAAEAAGIPSVISFTVETDGRLPSGQSLGEAIEEVDAKTGRVCRLLHDQLRSSDALCRRARGGR